VNFDRTDKAILRALERSRVIAAYRAEIDPAHLGLELHAFVDPRMRRRLSNAHPHRRSRR
jgi:hypothetical protein